VAKVKAAATPFSFGHRIVIRLGLVLKKQFYRCLNNPEKLDRILDSS
jgi:hypothetical protein